MKTKYSNLFSPFKIGNIVLKNRLMSSPISLFDALTTPEHRISYKTQGFYKLRAMGGASVINLGDALVHPSGGDFGYLGTRKLMICDKSIMPYLIDLTDEIHKYGAWANIELDHAGILSAGPNDDAWGPCNLVTENGGKVIGMTEAMIEEIVESYATCAKRAQFCGFDMVMVHAGHGWLLHEFLSPLHNHREDRFGGSIENRARLLVMIVERIRDVCGKAFPIEVRISGSEYTEGGYEIEDAIVVAKLLEHKIDLIHVSGGSLMFPESETYMHPTQFTKHGCNTELAAKIKQNVSTPVVSVASLHEPSMMEDVIASGKADLVAVGRSLIADPMLPTKARKGMDRDIRPCIRCLNCLSVGDVTGAARCSVNPVIGQPWEAIYPMKPAEHKKVLIAGGGPAGMQVAITAKERGHDVVLCERNADLGGLIRYTKDVPFKSDVYKFLNYLKNKVEDMGVDVRLGTEVTAKLVEEISPDVLVAALGSEALIPPIKGIEKAMPLCDVHEKGISVGDNIVIIGGGLAGCEAAVHYGMQGKNVTVVEMMEDYAPDANSSHRVALGVQLRNFATLITKTTCKEVTDTGIECVDDKGNALFIEADTTISATGMKPKYKEVEKLRDLAEDFMWIGDCRKVGQIQGAIRSGYDAGNYIGQI